MSSPLDRLERWSWHQSHDQATVLVLVPADTEEVEIYLDEKYLIASVHGQAPLIKGRLYGTVNAQTSSWQLERRRHNGNSRRKTRTASASASSDSSYAVLTDPEISSSFAASLESGAQSDAETFLETDVDEDHDMSIVRRISSALGSPSGSHDETLDGHIGIRGARRERLSANSPSRPPSPTSGADPSSSLSSLNSVRPTKKPTRLLTIYLDKTRAEIWPSLIVSGVPLHMSSNDFDLSTSTSADASQVSFSSTATITTEEQKWNMDPTSLVGVGLLVMHEDLDEGFEYFYRAWLQGQNAIAVMKLATTYLPLHSTPQRSSILPSEHSYMRYLQRVGGNPGLAKLYRDAGILHSEGLGNALASISSFGMAAGPFLLGTNEPAGTVDLDASRRYFRRAKHLDPTLDIPELPQASPIRGDQFVMPSLQLEHPSYGDKEDTGPFSSKEGDARHSRRRRDGMVQSEDGWSFLYLPGLLGAGLAIGIVSVSWWRRGNA